MSQHKSQEHTHISFTAPALPLCNQIHDHLGPWDHNQETRYTLSHTQLGFKTSPLKSKELKSESTPSSPTKNTSFKIQASHEFLDDSNTIGHLQTVCSNLSPYRSRKFVEHEMAKTNISQYFQRKVEKKNSFGISVFAKKKMAETSSVKKNSFYKQPTAQEPKQSKIERFNSLPQVSRVCKELELSRRIYVMMHRDKVVSQKITSKPRRENSRQKNSRPVSKDSSNSSKKQTQSSLSVQVNKIVVSEMSKEQTKQNCPWGIKKSHCKQPDARHLLGLIEPAHKLLLEKSLNSKILSMGARMHQR